MQVNVTVIAAMTEKAISKAGKPYDKVTLTYKVVGGRGAETKTIFPFKQKEIAAQALALLPQQQATLTLEKIGEYWELTAIDTAGDAATAEAVEAKTVVAGGQASNGLGYNASTKAYASMQDEKQIMIVRQSSIGHAVKLLGDNKGSGNYDAEDALAVAEDFVQYVLNGPTVVAPPAPAVKKPAAKKPVTVEEMTEDDIDVPY